MYLLNKIVGGCLNPLVIGLVAMALGCACVGLRWRRIGIWLSLGAIAWLWLWSTPMMCRWIGVALEREWPVMKAEDAPKTDAIVLLGGGMGANTNVYPYAEMWNGADRVWHAARLYKAGKAPIVIPSGSGERESAVPLLRDLGVPESAIVVEDKARNTEENAKFVSNLLNQSSLTNTCDTPPSQLLNLSTSQPSRARPKVLLVTSAWHMRRSVLMYRRYAPRLEIIPAAADYEATVTMGGAFGFRDIWPDAELLSRNSVNFKECLGYWGYRLLRK